MHPSVKTLLSYSCVENQQAWQQTIGDFRAQAAQTQPIFTQIAAGESLTYDSIQDSWQQAPNLGYNGTESKNHWRKDKCVLILGAVFPIIFDQNEMRVMNTLDNPFLLLKDTIYRKAIKGDAPTPESPSLAKLFNKILGCTIQKSINIDPFVDASLQFIAQMYNPNRDQQTLIQAMQSRQDALLDQHDGELVQMKNRHQATNGELDTFENSLNAITQKLNALDIRIDRIEVVAETNRQTIFVFVDGMLPEIAASLEEMKLEKADLDTHIDRIAWVQQGIGAVSLTTGSVAAVVVPGAGLAVTAVSLVTGLISFVLKIPQAHFAKSAIRLKEHVLRDEALQKQLEQHRQNLEHV